jgi:hypothetical protein
VEAAGDRTVTTLAQLGINHTPTAAELDVWRTAIIRSIPIRGVRVTAAGSIATTSGTTELDLAKYQLTGLTLVAGRYYIVRPRIAFTKTVAGDVFDVRLRANTAVSGTMIGLVSDLGSGVAAGSEEAPMMFLGSASYTSLYVSVVRISGTGTLTYLGTNGGFTRSYNMLEDKGDADNWTDVA